MSEHNRRAFRTLMQFIGVCCLVVDTITAYTSNPLQSLALGVLGLCWCVVARLVTS